jgi:hypothetical protein
MQNPEKFDFIKLGLIEILGAEDLEKIDGTSLPALKKAMANLYGETVARGMLLRAGRAGFYYWMNHSNESLGWKNSDFRLLPTRTKIKRGLQDFTTWMDREVGLASEIQNQPKVWNLEVSGTTSQDSIINCDFMAGMMQELLSWAGGGKFYAASETQCQSAGALKCVFTLEKLPLD